MSANPLEAFTAYAALNKPAELGHQFAPERRRWVRTKVHWPVLLFRNHSAEAVATSTQNLSSGGFYCLCQTPFILGEILICALKVPTHDPAGKALERQLECTVRVVRVEPDPEQGCFGVACRIEDYHFTPANSHERVS